MMNRCQVTYEEAAQANMRWTGTHVGVPWVVSYWGCGTMNDGRGMWNRYIVIPEAMIPDGFEALWLEPYEFGLTERKHVGYRYDDTKLADLEWNGGITFYKKIGGIDGIPRAIKVGCDYGHLWDSEMGYPYSLPTVRRDAEITCSAFREMFPASLYRCSWAGTHHPGSEMLTHPNNADCQFWRGYIDKVPDAWKPAE